MNVLHDCKPVTNTCVRASEERHDVTPDAWNSSDGFVGLGPALRSENMS